MYDFALSHCLLCFAAVCKIVNGSCSVIGCQCPAWAAHRHSATGPLVQANEEEIQDTARDGTKGDVVQAAAPEAAAETLQGEILRDLMADTSDAVVTTSPVATVVNSSQGLVGTSDGGTLSVSTNLQTSRRPELSPSSFVSPKRFCFGLNGEETVIETSHDREYYLENPAKIAEIVWDNAIALAFVNWGLIYEIAGCGITVLDAIMHVDSFGGGSYSMVPDNITNPMKPWPRPRIFPPPRTTNHKLTWPNEPAVKMELYWLLDALICMTLLIGVTDRDVIVDFLTVLFEEEFSGDDSNLEWPHAGDVSPWTDMHYFKARNLALWLLQQFQLVNSRNVVSDAVFYMKKRITELMQDDYWKSDSLSNYYMDVVFPRQLSRKGAEFYLTNHLYMVPKAWKWSLSDGTATSSAVASSEIIGDSTSDVRDADVDGESEHGDSEYSV